MRPSTKSPQVVPGKNEMWHAVSALGRCAIALGLKPGVDQEKFRAGLASHTLEDLFEVQPVRTGDTFFVPAGTPHSIGPNMVICEVQEYSDLTYRVYDFGPLMRTGKPRELHIDKALQVTNFGKPAGGKVTPLLLLPMANQIAACCLPLLCGRTLGSVPRMRNPVEPERFELIVILEGAGSFAWPESAARYHRANAGWCPPHRGRIDVSETATSSDPDLCAGHSCNADRIASRWDFTRRASTSYFD